MSEMLISIFDFISEIIYVFPPSTGIKLSTHGTEEYFAHRLAISIIMIKDFGYNTVLFEM